MVSYFSVEDVLFSILIGAIPTCSMLLASFALMNLKVQPLVEACFQNFCAGLILAAVAMELFPLMAPSELISPFSSIIGTSAGFTLGILMINGVDQLISSYEKDTHKHGDLGVTPKCEVSCKNYQDTIAENKATTNTSQKWESSPLGTRRMPWMSSGANTQDFSAEMKGLAPDRESTKILNRQNSISKQSYGQQYSLITKIKDEIDVGHYDLDRAGCAEDGYDHEAILYAAIAIATPAHRAHIKEHFLEIMNAINVLESNTISLMTGNDSLELRQSEKLAEDIDEEIHMLQYRLDHTRRCVILLRPLLLSSSSSIFCVDNVK